MNKKTMLTSPAQLLDIAAESEEPLIFTWDQDEAESLILHGDRVLWREETGWEVYERFVEIVDILRAKYGARLRDVVPTVRSEYALYGDTSRAWPAVQTARRSLQTSGDE